MISFNQEDLFLVTGATSGIGEGTARRLNELGATVIATGRNEKKLSELKNSVAYSDNLITEPKDLTEDIGALPKWVKSLKDKYGKLRGLICCAGMDMPKALQIIEEGEAKGLFDVNYFAPLFLAKGFADRRVNTGNNASMVFIASTAGVSPERGQAIYAASKAALIASAKSMSRELADKGIRVNCISPAFVETPMYYKNLETIGANIDEYPLGIGKVEDVSAMAAFLCADEARWITGQNYVLDGGYL